MLSVASITLQRPIWFVFPEYRKCAWYKIYFLNDNKWPNFLICKMITAFLIDLLGDLSEIMYIKCFIQGLQHSKHLINMSCYHNENGDLHHYLPTKALIFLLKRMEQTILFIEIHLTNYQYCFTWILITSWVRTHWSTVHTCNVIGFIEFRISTDIKAKNSLAGFYHFPKQKPMS